MTSPNFSSNHIFPLTSLRLKSKCEHIMLLSRSHPFPTKALSIPTPCSNAIFTIFKAWLTSPASFSKVCPSVFPAGNGIPETSFARTYAWAQALKWDFVELEEREINMWIWVLLCRWNQRIWSSFENMEWMVELRLEGEPNVNRVYFCGGTSD